MQNLDMAITIISQLFYAVNWQLFHNCHNIMYTMTFQNKCYMQMNMVCCNISMLQTSHALWNKRFVSLKTMTRSMCEWVNKENGFISINRPYQMNCNRNSKQKNVLFQINWTMQMSVHHITMYTFALISKVSELHIEWNQWIDFVR